MAYYPSCTPYYEPAYAEPAYSGPIYGERQYPAYELPAHSYVAPAYGEAYESYDYAEPSPYEGYHSPSRYERYEDRYGSPYRDQERIPSPSRERPKSPFRSKSPFREVEPEEVPKSDSPPRRRPLSEWNVEPVKEKSKLGTSLSPFPQSSMLSHPGENDTRALGRPELELIRPPSKAERRARDDGVDDDAFSLALSEVTTVTPEHMMLSLGEELVLLKAGDRPKFAKNDALMDAVCSCALLLDLVDMKRVGVDGTQNVTARNLVLRVLDDAPTGSKLANSAIANLKKKPKQPPTVRYWIKKTSSDLCSAYLWRLVNKGKVNFDPRMWGKDRFPVKATNDLSAIRERLVAVIERTNPNPPLKDMFLALLYYLPSDASSKIFADRGDHFPEDVQLISKAVFHAVEDMSKVHQHWI